MILIPKEIVVCKLFLRNVSVSTNDSTYGLDGGNSVTEEVSFTYQKIEWSWGASNPTVTDTINN